MNGVQLAIPKASDGKRKAEASENRPRSILDEQKSCKISQVMRSFAYNHETGLDLLSSSVAKGRVFWPGPKLQQLDTAG